MKKTCVILCCVLIPAAIHAQGSFFSFQRESVKKPSQVRLEWDVDFDYRFDNREYDASGNLYAYSETVHGVYLTPSIGFGISQGKGTVHRVMLGADLFRDMGAGGQNVDLLKEFTFYYDVHVRRERLAFEGVAGCFPRAYMEGEYGQAFFDDKYLFLDRNLEGMLLKVRARSLFAELGLDWMGKKGPVTHERFQVFSHGAWTVLDWLSLGWSGSFYHYACSDASPGVVDNHLLSPWAKLDFAKLTGMQRLSLKAAWLYSYQWDRKQGSLQNLSGGEVSLAAGHWNLGLENSVYFGSDLQPLFAATDLSGAVYGSDLYFGNPNYQAGFYDMAELFWQPKLTPYLDLRVSLRLHFGNVAASAAGFLGSQQMVSFRLNLDAFRNPSSVSGRVGNPFEKKPSPPVVRMRL